MKKDRYSQNTVREIPLVQIPYDKAAEELRLSRIKKQRKQIYWICIKGKQLLPICMYTRT